MYEIHTTEFIIDFMFTWYLSLPEFLYELVHVRAKFVHIIPSSRPFIESIFKESYCTH